MENEDDIGCIMYKGYSDEMLEEMFKAYTGGDIEGSINTEVFKELMKLKFGKEMTLEEMSKLMDQIDRDRNGTVEFDEFKEFMKEVNKRRTHEEIIKEVFKILDRDGKGYISPEDIFHIFLALGDKIPLEKIQYVLKKDIKEDTEGDGNLNYFDFKKVFEKDDEEKNNKAKK